METTGNTNIETKCNDYKETYYNQKEMNNDAKW